MIAPSSTIVYVVDDDADVRASLARLLASAGHEVIAFDSPRAFLDGFDRDAHACLLLDLAMPDIDGLELQRLLEDDAQAIPIVFLTGHADVRSSVQAMKHGAVDLLQKPVEDDVLLATVGQALAKAATLRAQAGEQRRVAAILDALTPRERQVLQGVVGGRLNKQIAADLGTAEKTIKFHRGNVMRKFNVRTVADLVRLAQRAGIGSR